MLWKSHSTTHSKCTLVACMFRLITLWGYAMHQSSTATKATEREARETVNWAEYFSLDHYLALQRAQLAPKGFKWRGPWRRVFTGFCIVFIRLLFHHLHPYTAAVKQTWGRSMMWLSFRASPNFAWARTPWKNLKLIIWLHRPGRLRQQCRVGLPLEQKKSVDDSSTSLTFVISVMPRIS